MWSTFRSLLSLASLISSACIATAELSIVASVKQHGKHVDASSLSLIRTPPQEHRWHAPWPRRWRNHNNKTVERDAVSYSANWCGASQHATDSDGIKNVLGYFTAPDLTLRPGTPAPQFAAAWVGIDGAECNTTLLQAGVTTIVNADGGQSSSAWWQWYPEASFTIETLKVKPGEWVSVNITTKDDSSAILTMENTDTGLSVTLELNNGPQLCRRDAEWILEDFFDAGKQVALAHFADLWFVDSGATTKKGKKVGFDGATMVHLQDENGKVLCSPEPYDDSNFVVVSNP